MSFESRVKELINQVPYGQVASYGQIAAMAGSPRAARTVGWILRSNSDQLPWHRIISSSGRVTIANINIPASQQAAMLREEGVAIVEKKGHFWLKEKGRFWQNETENIG